MDAQGGWPVQPQPLPYGPDAPAATAGPAPAAPAPSGRRAVTASWLQRVCALLLDHVLAAVPWLLVGPYAWFTAERYTSEWTGEPVVMTTQAADWAILVAVAVHVVVWVANRWVVQGRTGRSWGKRLMGLRLVDGRTGGAVGTGRTVGRELAHVLDAPGMIGFLAPLWDGAGRTFADMVVGTVVVQERVRVSPAPTTAG